MQQPQAPEPQPEPEALPAEPELEPEPEASRVTLMALGDNLIHNTVYWSAELPEGGYDFAPFYEAIAPIVSQYDIACINQETILVGDPGALRELPQFRLSHAGGGRAGENRLFRCDRRDEPLLRQGARQVFSIPAATGGSTIRRSQRLAFTIQKRDAKTLRVIEKNGIRIAMLNYTYGLNGGAPGKAWMVDRLVTFDAVEAILPGRRKLLILSSSLPTGVKRTRSGQTTMRKPGRRSWPTAARISSSAGTRTLSSPRAF